MEIPKGNSKEDKEKRRLIIMQNLAKFKKQTVVCPCLGGVPVSLNSEALYEIAYHASKSVKSTELALDYENLIKTAKFVRGDIPKDEKQRKRMQFEFVFELSAKSKGIKAKLIIGVKANKSFLQYSITAVEE